MTRPGDVRLASELGVDGVGFIFARRSPRRVEPEEARAMRHAMAPFVDAVALFMDNPQAEVREIIRHVRPTLLQFHGSEDDAFCRGFGLPFMKTLPMGEGPADAGGRSGDHDDLVGELLHAPTPSLVDAAAMRTSSLLTSS